MYGMNKLTDIYKTARAFAFDDASRLVFLSDCHRGDGSWADTFEKNQNICLGALSYYYAQGFTYIEIGDGDELWENRSMSAIVNTHKDIYGMLRNFYSDGRLFLLYGNHDMQKRSVKFVRQNLWRYFDASGKACVPLMENIEVHEGIVLHYAPTGNDILVVHGHQVDLLNNSLWRLAKWLVRNVWRPLEIFGVNDPTSTAKNYNRKASVEKKLIRWAVKEGKMLIAGHTHRPVFPDIGEPLYFNDGSCVHPESITAMEIANGRIALVKWCIKLKQDGALYVGREGLAGPVSLKSFFEAPLKKTHVKIHEECPP